MKKCSILALLVIVSLFSAQLSLTDLAAEVPEVPSGESGIVTPVDLNAELPMAPPDAENRIGTPGDDASPMEEPARRESTQVVHVGSLPDGEVPKADLPEVPPAADDTVIVDPEVPMGNLPQTGTLSDSNVLFLTLAALSAALSAGLLVLTLSSRKKKEG